MKMPGSLRRRFILGIILLNAVLMGAFVTDLVQRQRRFLHEDSIAHSLDLIQGIARSSTLSVLAGDVVGAQEVLVAITDTHDLRYAFVVDEDGKVLAHTDRAMVGKHVADPVSLSLRDAAPKAVVLVDTAQIIDAAAPIMEGERRVGWARGGIGQQQAADAAAMVGRNGVVYALIAILAGGLFAAWVARGLTRGLYGLLAVAEATRTGERGRRADTKRSDEVGLLAVAFNRMLDSMADSEKELRALNEELERRVEARTADLSAATEAVRKNEVMFRGLLESSADAVVIVDESGAIVLVNAECTKVFGYERSELIGQKVEMLIPSRFADHSGLRHAYCDAPRIRPMGVGLEVLGQRKDGTVFPAEVRLSPLHTEDGLIISAVVRDITERKLAEDRLLQSEQKYRLLLENLPHRVFFKDRDSVFRTVNPAFARLFERPPEDFVGKTDFDFQDRSRALHIQELDRKVMSAGVTLDFDEEFLQDDELRIYHTLKAPVRADSGEIIGLLGISWDITDRKRAENALTGATRNAEAANRAKSDFLANMSHEIRTPMNAVIGLAHLLAQTQLDPRQQDYLTKIRSSANSLLALLNDILDLSKVESGKLELESRPFRLDEQLRNLATILSTNAQYKDIEVLFRVDPAVPADLVGDAFRLQQVLINLGGNAIKFTEAGEVVVSVTPVELSAERAVLRFSFRDTGIGISPDQRRRLFQAFQQADSSTSRKFGGTGLGLAISSRLVRMMGGELDVDSVFGKGSDFAFTATFGRSAASSLVSAAPRNIPTGLRVMVVDDNPTAREVMESLVATFGWQADVADSGAAALRLLEAATIPYDVVLLDWKMPGMDGLETSKRIRDATRDGVPPIIIVVTAYGRDVVARTGGASNVNAMLVKPVTASMLFDEIANLYDSAPVVVEAEPKARPLAELRLLVAEDNAINQQVVCEMLTQAGATVVLANNGREAVEMFRCNQPLDAVLMDIQMPEMDGFTATRALRAEGVSLPIIAMTANAMASDRVNCLEAGMNDHVAKPLDPDLLVRTIAQWTNGAHLAPAAPMVECPDTLRMDGIDVASVLWRLGGDEMAVKRLLRAFVQQAPVNLDACRVALEAGDVKALTAAAHALNGMSGNVGARGVNGAASMLEAAARDNRTETLPGLLTELQRVVAAVVAEIEHSAAGWDQAISSSHAVDPLALGHSLTELAGLLAQNNFAAADLFDRIRVDMVAMWGAKAVEPLAHAIDGFDFTAAQPMLAELSKI
ncbi:MAG: response regulator [Rhodospirillaceae bacterium]|nr:response regulator [Rhodospirillales bacterium]